MRVVCLLIASVSLFACDMGGPVYDDVEPTNLFGATDETVKECMARLGGPGNVWLIHGTSSQSATWMECWRRESGEQCLANVCYCVAGQNCSLPATQLDGIANGCRGEVTTAAKIQCVGKAVEATMNDQAVCRHHAQCTKEALARLGLTGRFRGGFMGGKGHAWNEIRDPRDGRTIVADAYNDIYYKIP